MRRPPKFFAAVEATIDGLRWTVRDSAGNRVTFAQSQAEAKAEAAKLSAKAKSALAKKKAAKPAKPARVQHIAPASKAKFSEPEFNQWLGRRIRTRRNHLGLTMVELADLAGKGARSYVHKVEKGQCSASIGYLRAICGPLKWTLVELIDGVDATEELTRLRAIEARCIKHLDDSCLEKVTGRPWQEMRK